MNNSAARCDIRTTTLLIPNLHCNSCVAQVETILDALHPQPFSVSRSIVAHTVSVSHTVDLPIATVTKALDEAGFDVYEENRISRRISGAFEQAVQKWRSGANDVDSRKRKRHMENCEACRVKNSIDGRTQESSTPQTRTLVEEESKERVKSEPLPLEKVVAVVSTAQPQQFEAAVAIEGMTCASCTGAITNALEREAWVQKVDVSLLTHSATIKYTGEDNKNKILEVIEDVGFEASLQQAKALAATKTANKEFEATVAIEGMTCASCTNSVTGALEAQPWIHKVDVSLLTHDATVLFEGEENKKDEIAALVKDIGFEATLQHVRAIQVDRLPINGTSRTPPQDTRRSVAIQVDGMYCEHCPLKIMSIMDTFLVTVEKPPSRGSPVVEISYVPDAPAFTLRTLLKAIEAKDPAFQAKVHHEKSLEERSRQMQRQQRNAIVRRLVLAVIAAIPTFIIGVVYMDLVASTDRTRMYFEQTLSGVERSIWTMFVLATPVYFYSANLFHRKALKELRALWRPRSPVPILRRFFRFGSMNMLISLGTSIAYWASLAQIIVAATHRGSDQLPNQSNETYFDSVVFLTMFLLVGRLIEAYSKAKTGDAVNALGNLRANTALLVTEDSAMDGEDEKRVKSIVTEVDVDLIDTGDILRILPGSSPPCDAVVVSGNSRFDESSLTGESRPVPKAPDDEVFAGTVNQDSALNVRVTGAAGNSMLDQIITVIREGQTKGAPIERTASMLTAYFVPVVTYLALLVWIIWLSLGYSGTLPADYLDQNVGGWAFWSLQFAIAVFVVACPCGLGLAAPTALFVGSGIAAQHGILVKGGGEAFQEASTIDVVAFDKTGTLTVGGEPKIVDAMVEEKAPKSILALVAALERDSSHPVAKALVDYCSKSDASESHDTQYTQEVPGKGMKGAFESNGTALEIIVGNEALLRDNEVTLSEANISRLEAWKKLGYSVALAATRSLSSQNTSITTAQFTLAAMFAASDPLRPEASSIIHTLQSLNISTWMISGDNPTTAQAVAAQIGIPVANVIAGVLPTEKADKIKYLQQSQPARRSRFGRTRSRATVAMIGDGINDAPALSTADVGIALASGADVAVQTAPFVVLNPSSSAQLDLNTLLTLIKLSQKVFGRVRLNFAWALGYNLVLVPLAAGVLYPVKQGGGHTRIDPAWAALAMALSSVSVVVSSLALRWAWLPGVGFRSGSRGVGREEKVVEKEGDVEAARGEEERTNRWGRFVHD